MPILRLRLPGPSKTKEEEDDNDDDDDDDNDDNDEELVRVFPLLFKLPLLSSEKPIIGKSNRYIISVNIIKYLTSNKFLIMMDNGEVIVQNNKRGKFGCDKDEPTFIISDCKNFSPILFK